MLQVVILIILLSAWTSAESIFNVPDSPHVPPTTTKGMVIDAGSGGSRLHVYSWKPRIFNTVPPPISFPESDESWTDRITPGIDTLENTYSVIGGHLTQLIEFAKQALIDYHDSFGNFPIYFYATGGMRELSFDDREAIMTTVRSLLRDDNFCPFYFRDDFARVISGEEEAIFSWAATNFLMGTLLPASEGLGIVTAVNHTYGTLDLGGASTQIAFFVPSQDISDGLYKLQIGSQKQWNVYAKSFLTFGINSARRRHLQQLADEAIENVEIKHSADTTTPIANALNYCFHAGYSEITTDSTGRYSVEVKGPNLPSSDQLDLCMKSVRPLLEQKANTFCDKAYNGDCSFAGAYQPQLPIHEHGHFIGTSSYEMPWKFLMLPETSSLDYVKERADAVCQMNFDDVLFYYETNRLIMDGDHIADLIPYFCFLSSYVIVLLKDGYHFKNTQTITVLDQVKGNKVSWALGAILFEINELPWKLELSTIETHAWGFMILAAFIGFFIGAVFAIFMYREVVEANISRNTAEDETYQAMKRIPTLELVRMPTQSTSQPNDNGTIHPNSDNMFESNVFDPTPHSLPPSGLNVHSHGKLGSPTKRKSAPMNPPQYTSPYDDPLTARSSGSSNHSTPYMSPRSPMVTPRKKTENSMDWVGSFNVLKHAFNSSSNNRYSELPT